MSLDPVKQTYEKLGRDDPLYAVLSRKGLEDNKWDPEEFFETGRREIEAVLGYVDQVGLPLHRGRALDFGCAVGRLSQALAEHFERVAGVDISASMVERARDFNRHGSRVEYFVNTVPNLRILDSESFDFVYSNITLQHIPPDAAAEYIREFFRVLRPGGIAVFQVPNGPPLKPGSLRARLYMLRRRHLRRLWKRVRGKPPVEIHYIAVEHVRALIRESGARLVDEVGLGRRRRQSNLRYCAVKEAPSE
ncbi:MAG: class I SAM-dependent methyltransferase [Gemmatimonadales bacterium]|nr:MAG: class I SAM-dependent methyltransferase [Gemmatimonadales bacterium]